MRKASYTAAAPCSMDAPGRKWLATHPDNYNNARRELQDMDRMCLNERGPHCLALAMPGFRAGVNER